MIFVCLLSMSKVVGSKKSIPGGAVGLGYDLLPGVLLLFVI